MTDFEKTLSVKQKMLWKAFKIFMVKNKTPYNKMSDDEKETAQDAFMRECMERRIY